MPWALAIIITVYNPSNFTHLFHKIWTDLSSFSPRNSGLHCDDFSTASTRESKSSSLSLVLLIKAFISTRYFDFNLLAVVFGKFPAHSWGKMLKCLSRSILSCVFLHFSLLFRHVFIFAALWWFFSQQCDLHWNRRTCRASFKISATSVVDFNYLHMTMPITAH